LHCGDPCTGSTAIFVETDVSQSAQAHRMVEAAVQVFGRINVLFCNVGVIVGNPVTQVPEEESDRVMNVI